MSPGWRDLWIATVRERAIGNDADKFGLNTAKAGQVQDLLAFVGVIDALRGISADLVPEHLQSQVSSVADAVNHLVELRGHIVHTGSVPDSLRKAHVREWRDFVEKLANELDTECRKQLKALSGS